jgi:hypothetical protein
MRGEAIDDVRKKTPATTASPVLLLLRLLRLLRLLCGLWWP